MIGIINLGLGNLKSIINVIDAIGGESLLISNPDDLIKFDKLILPGVGYFAEGVQKLKDTGFWNLILKDVIDNDKMLLGICLGMQLLCQHSEEGNVNGLGLVDATVKKFNFSDNLSLKVPHMGWNKVRISRENQLLPMDEEERRFYFVHSYKVVPNKPDISIGQSDYGGEFCAAFQQGNVFGVQFHPEKSHRFGKALIKRFVEL
jgi:glutamine amidotransferase